MPQKEDMTIETLSVKMNSLGIPDSQATLLDGHLREAQKYVFEQDPGMDEALSWLKQSLSNALLPEEAEVLFQVVSNNKPDNKVEYLEEGYDSCQSHRKLSKVAGEAILLGGLAYEYGLVGVNLVANEAKQVVSSGLEIEESDFVTLTDIAKKYGSKQDFLFPGVTPSSPLTPSLEELAVDALHGHPRTTVRTLTGVGGFRYDKDWNYATDLVTFVDLKLTEDKRYYPGVGIFYFLMKHGLEAMPLVAKIMSQPALYGALQELDSGLKSTVKQEFSGVSVLCSTYIPTWEEMKRLMGYTSAEYLELAESFHSPSYEFVILKGIFEKLNKGANIDPVTISWVHKLKGKLSHCWSFNSTIHLPWTAQLADLAGGLMGRITNGLGDFAMRYGIGYKGKALEVREYFFGNSRSFPYGVGGSKAYDLRFYPHSESFQGSYKDTPLVDGNCDLLAIKKEGFLRYALTHLNYE